VKERLEERLKKLPRKPGVYIFRGERGDILYVGKAKVLQPRVRSYFQQSGDTRAGISRMVERIADLEVIVTGTEVEALHLEQNLVKRHRPPVPRKVVGEMVILGVQERTATAIITRVAQEVHTGDYVEIQ